MRTGAGRDGAEAVGMTVLLGGVGAVAFGIVLAIVHEDALWLLLAVLGGVLAVVALRAVRHLGFRADPVEESDESDEIDEAFESVASIEHVRLVSEQPDRVSLELTVTAASARGPLSRRIPADMDRGFAERHVEVGGRMRIWHATFDPDAVDDVLWIEARDLA